MCSIRIESASSLVPDLESSLATLHRTLQDQEQQEARLERMFQLWQQRLEARRAEMERQLERICAALVEEASGEGLPKLSLFQ